MASPTDSKLRATTTSNSELLQVKVKLQKEAVKQDQFAIHYDKLKALNTRMETGLDLPVIGGDLTAHNELLERKRAEKDAESLLKFPKKFDRTGRPKPVVTQFDTEMQQLRMFMEKLEARHISGLKTKEVCTQITAQWEKDYFALFREFEDFQSAMTTLIQSEGRAVEEKIARFEAENEQIRREFEREKVKLEASNRDLQRDKSCNECEIRTLRNELDENRRKLEDKSITLDSLTRELDLVKFQSLAINSPHHEEIASLEVQLKAVQSRNSFLENELQSQSDKNSRILQEFDTMRELSDVKNKELRDKIHNLELSLLQQHDHFSKQIQAFTDSMNTQKTYISEMEEQLRDKDDENQNILLKAQDHVKNFMDDSLESIQKLEIEKQDLLKMNEELDNELDKLRQNLALCSDRISNHGQVCIQICKDALQPGQLVGTDLSTDKSQLLVILKDEGKLSHQQGLSTDQKLSWEESMLRKVANYSLRTSTTQFLEKIDHLQGRISELEDKLKLDKYQRGEEVSKLQKKCKKYGQLIRKLRSRMLPSLENEHYADAIVLKRPTASFHNTNTNKLFAKKSHILVTRKTTIPKKARRKKGEKRCITLTMLQEKHVHFQEILKNVG